MRGTLAPTAMRRRRLLVSLAFLGLAAGCGTQPAPDTSAVQTAAAQEVLAQLTAEAPAPTSTPLPQATEAPAARPEAADPGQPAGPGASPADLQACVEGAAGMSLPELMSLSGGTFSPGQLASGPLAQALPAERIEALEACFATAGAAMPGAQMPAMPGDGQMPGTTPPGGFPGGTAPARDEAAALAAVEKVRPSVVLVGELLGPGLFAGGGTGFLISSDGYVMTNAHVLNSAKTGNFAVTLFDGRQLPARLVGYVESVFPDVGVLKVEGTGLPAVTFGDSSQLVGGETLLAVGHPTGYGFWLATGGRLMEASPAAEQQTRVVQVFSDVPSAPGGSGSPMVNMRGEVVGLLYGARAGAPGEIDMSPSPLTVIADWEAFWSLRQNPGPTAAVSSNDAQRVADLIIAEQRNLSREDLALGAPPYRVEGAVVRVKVPTGVPLDPLMLNEGMSRALSGFPGYQLTSSAVEGDEFVLVFNQPLPEAAAQEVVKLFEGFSAGAQEGAPMVVPQPTPTPVPVPTARPEHARLAEVARQVMPSVVLVRSRSGDFIGVGTGFILSEDGYIMTNAHVVADNGEPYQEYEVHFHDGRRAPARLVGFDLDQDPDVGVLKVDGSGLPAARFGDPRALEPDDGLFLVGHPGGYGFWLVTSGAFVRLERVGNRDDIQAGVPHSGGNSGGPLLDLQGEVVGLMHGEPVREMPPIEPGPLEIHWTWAGFEALAGANLAASVAIDDALAVARQIIARQGSVP